MQVEIEIALNFIISYLYNKLPRRRVNIFGEELEKALKHKFQGHWYPDQPVKVSDEGTRKVFPVISPGTIFILVFPSSRAPPSDASRRATLLTQCSK